MISIIHPSRGRPDKSVNNILKWMDNKVTDVELIVSLDSDDNVDRYINTYSGNWLLDPNGPVFKGIIVNHNRSCVDAINNAAKVATGDIFIVVSDDTDCFTEWDTTLLRELEGKEDYLLKTDDGIQDYIVTMTVMDRKYYERDGYIYHPDFKHQFADTYMTCVADMRGRLIHSDLNFPHLHYSYSGGKEIADALHHRNNETWKDGQDTFIKLMEEFTSEERSRIKNPGMRGFLRKFGL